MRYSIYISLSVLFILVFPLLGDCQTVTPDSFSDLHDLLQQVRDQMIPLCSGLITVARAIAGIAALGYICYRVWGSLARAEAIDFYPLFRPMFIGIAIIFFQP
jgi:hypothetical protein